MFGDCLGKAVTKVASAFCDCKALGDCFVLSDLSRPKPPKDRYEVEGEHIAALSLQEPIWELVWLLLSVHQE